MNQMRGILLLLAGGFALYRGWVIHRGPWVWAALALGITAIALGLWRLSSKSLR
jgi:hypothetical protein